MLYKTLFYYYRIFLYTHLIHLCRKYEFLLHFPYGIRKYQLYRNRDIHLPQYTFHNYMRFWQDKFPWLIGNIKIKVKKIRHKTEAPITFDIISWFTQSIRTGNTIPAIRIIKETIQVINLTYWLRSTLSSIIILF